MKVARRGMKRREKGRERMRDENEEYDNDKEDEAEEEEDSEEDKDENYVDKEEEEDGKEDAEVIASICESLPRGFGFCSAVWVAIQLSPNHSLKRLSSITLNTSCHLLLAYTVSAEKSADCLTGVPLYLNSCFFLAAFKIISLSFIFSI